MYELDETCKAMVAALKKLCAEKGMNPHALAVEAGISPSTISYLMSGKTNPQVHTILTLCNVLGVSVSELFDEKVAAVPAKCSESDMLYITAGEKKLLNSFRQLSDRKRELLSIYVEMLQQYEDVPDAEE